MQHSTFRRNEQADSNGTCLKGRLVGNYQQFVEKFGKPIEFDGDKVSGEWIFESENGDVVTLYDWKSTNLYEETLPTVEEFRQLPKSYFNIGAHSQEVADAFYIWLVNQFTLTIEDVHELK